MSAMVKTDRWPTNNGGAETRFDNIPPGQGLVVDELPEHARVTGFALILFRVGSIVARHRVVSRRRDVFGSTSFFGHDSCVVSGVLPVGGLGRYTSSPVCRRRPLVTRSGSLFLVWRKQSRYVMKMNEKCARQANPKRTHTGSRTGSLSKGRRESGGRWGPVGF